ncbi:NAD(P)/FAD-dependent oxidoreductase [Sinomonas sp. JGH33]|uniref:NAD(P)/FAD-dependent oxidoreductase n=1 Tax=Sinomonas terricola TaxID=3110330 RepID=A0ABU5TBA1_9MICC|nr:NAD(P)/FAD-dependent oxidoreductase [Sinomonas sp. JGH33]MEA5456381.1 NAD(P)/FAD-dependent oxidoreductase [Sinomonas sp. JGH33]
MESEYDVIVIGAGAAGENAADRVVKGGLTAALVESDLVGGACSYWACEPSKALLRPGTALHAARRVPGAREAVTGQLAVEAVLAHRNDAVNSWDDSSQADWATGAGITLIRGRARLTGAKRLSVADAAGNHFPLVARHAVVLATGSTPSIPKVPGLQHVSHWTTPDATSAREVPESLVVLGGGVAGSELAQAFARLGSRVTVLARGHLLSGFPEDARSLVATGLREDGVEILEGVTPELIEPTDDGGARLTLPDGRTLEAAKVLVSAGRRPALDGLGLPAFGIEPASLRVDETGLVIGNSWLYAVGDCSGRAMLTHQGKYQARITGDTIVARARGDLDGRPAAWSRHARTADELAVPRVVFTDPEAAMVGLSEEEAWEHGIRVRAVDLPISVAGAWQHAVDYEGWARFLVDEDRRTIVGACFAGPDVAELLQAATIAIVGEITLERLWHAIPAFPTVSEVWLRFLEAYGL